MQVDPISATSRRAAAEALEDLRAFYAAQARRHVLEGEYLHLLGQVVKQMENERTKNADLFDTFRRPFG